MTPYAFITMLIVQILVSIITLYFMIRVLKKKHQTKE